MLGPLILLLKGINFIGTKNVGQINLTKGPTPDFGAQDVLSCDFNISELHDLNI
jgi:hypothetical protein